jgi:hypothetical protein
VALAKLLLLTVTFCGWASAYGEPDGIPIPAPKGTFSKACSIIVHQEFANQTTRDFCDYSFEGAINVTSSQRSIGPDAIVAALKPKPPFWGKDTSIPPNTDRVCKDNAPRPLNEIVFLVIWTSSDPSMNVDLIHVNGALSGPVRDTLGDVAIDLVFDAGSKFAQTNARTIGANGIVSPIEFEMTCIDSK